MELYKNWKKKNLSEYETINSDIYASKIDGLTLEEYCLARKYLCSTQHNDCDCDSMIQAANIVLKDGIISMATVFKTIYPNVTYALNARRRLLQMPMVAIRIWGELYLMEKVNGLNYSAIITFIANQKPKREVGMTKSELKELLKIATAEKERECIRYAVYKASNLTPTQAKLHLGLDNMKSRALRVEECIDEVKQIDEAYSDLARTQEFALFDCYGVESSEFLSPEVSSEEPDLSGTEHERKSHDACTSGLTQSDTDDHSLSTPDDSVLFSTLRQSGYNWFELVERMEDTGISDAFLEDFFLRLPNIKDLDQPSLELIVQSHRAFCAAKTDSYEEDRKARYVNGEVVSDSDSSSACEDDKKAFIQKKRQAIRKRVRLKVKAVTKKRFLSRGRSKKTSKIIQQYPNIGEIIEEFVKDHNIGADAWRHTGILTFDGNANIKCKVTYKKIQSHLKQVLGREFGYGTVVELCMPRNKRRKSAKRYRGLAQVTTRRARKGFCLRFNPNTHWSASFYKGLNQVQYKDGTDILNINRDDAAGFRLDTLTSCKQYATPVVSGNEVLTTRTDFVNRYPSVLQTTSYNFTKTNTTAEVCVGIVKAVPLHHKNPAQHFSDLVMLSETDTLQPVFQDKSSGVPKLVDCIRVDGATDEGPAHESIQYWWTVWHITQSKAATLVTTRSSGSSYLNRV